MAALADVYNKALRKLGLLRYGQTASSELTDDITDAYTELYQRLDEENLVTWTTTGAVPDQYVWIIVTLLAAQRANEYGIPNDRYKRIMGESAGAMRELRRLIAGPYTPSHTEALDY